MPEHIERGRRHETFLLGQKWSHPSIDINVFVPPTRQVLESTSRTLVRVDQGMAAGNVESDTTIDDNSGERNGDYITESGGRIDSDRVEEVLLDGEGCDSVSMFGQTRRRKPTYPCGQGHSLIHQGIQTKSVDLDRDMEGSKLKL